MCMYFILKISAIKFQKLLILLYNKLLYNNYYIIINYIIIVNFRDLSRSF